MGSTIDITRRPWKNWKWLTPCELLEMKAKWLGDCNNIECVSCLEKWEACPEIEEHLLPTIPQTVTFSFPLQYSQNIFKMSLTNTCIYFNFEQLCQRIIFVNELMSLLIFTIDRYEN